jgi:hypothetical protein
LESCPCSIFDLAKVKDTTMFVDKTPIIHLKKLPTKIRGLHYRHEEITNLLHIIRSKPSCPIVVTGLMGVGKS